MSDVVADYKYADVTCWSAMMWPAIKNAIDRHSFSERKAFDLGCGNGSFSNLLSELGFTVVGVDPSATEIAIASQHFPHLEFHQGSAYDDLARMYGQFPLVVSLEVVEHCYDPRKFAQTLWQLVETGGIAIVSTPYHGYVKNLALAIAGKWDDHLNPLWDGGHIKFFSPRTLTMLLTDAGFRDVRFIRVGRIPLLAKSMIAFARK